MYIVLLFRDEFLIADTASVRPNATVPANHMYGERLFMAEAFGTLLALIRLDDTMNSEHVCIEQGAEAKGHITLIAFMWLFARMCAFVIRQLCGVGVAIATCLALVGPRVCLNMLF